MSFKISSIHSGIALAALALIAAGQNKSPQANPPRELVTELVATLNTKDKVKIRTFIQRHLISNVGVDQRVTRWMDLASQGAPFKLVRDVRQTDESLVVIVVDKNGARIAMTLHYEGKPNLMVLGLQLAPAFAIEGSPPELRDWANLKSLAAKVEAKAHSPGIGIGVIRNGVPSVVVAGIRNIKGKDPVLPDDPWSIGSIGKPICSTIIGLLIEQGKLRWDETLKQALADIPMNSGYNQVTIEQVMHHRGGIPEDLGMLKVYVDRIVGKAKTPVAIRDQYVRDILKREPIAAPGAQFAYSNAGYALLAHIAEILTGKPYEAMVKDMIFRPLGMKHSYTGADVLPRSRPSGHVEGPNGLEPEDMSGPMEVMFAGAGGGMFMSVGDIAKFGQAHLNGLRGHDGLLKASTVQRLHRGLPERGQGGRLYASGWGIETLPGVETFHGHNGSNGTMRAQLAIFPDANLVVVGVVNRDGENEPSPGMEIVLAIAERWAARR